MLDRGHTYEPDYWIGVDSAAGEAIWEDFLGLTDPVRAAKSGYAAVQSPEALDRIAWEEDRAAGNIHISTEYQAYLTDLYGPSYVAALLGNPSEESFEDHTACWAQADNALEPRVSPADNNIQEKLGAEAKRRAQGSPEVGRATDSWRRCMRNEGYELDSIPLPVGNQRDGGPVAYAQAIADVDCKLRVDLVDTYISSIYRFEDEVIAENSDELQSFEAYTDARIDAARAVLGEAR
jgi:hypothetical protein